jgi:hypothetical protein
MATQTGQPIPTPHRLITLYVPSYALSPSNEVPIPSKGTHPKCLHPYFFPRLFTVSANAGQLPNVTRVAPQVINSPSESQERPPVTDVPQIVTAGGGGPNGDPDDGSDGSDDPGRNRNHPNVPPQHPRLPNTPNSRPMPTVRQSVDRQSTPGRAGYAPIGLPDVPGMGGLRFQDEDPIWIQLVEALDNNRGLTTDDVTHRTARSMATARIRINEYLIFTL